MKKIIFILYLVLWKGITGIIAQPVVDFTASQVEGCGSLEVVFQNLTTHVSNDNLVYSWDLGGVISDRENPGKIFDVPDKYTICLTATDESGQSDVLCKDNYIVVHQPPLVDFDLTITKGCAPLDVNFINLTTSENNIVELIWDVGGSANVVKTADVNQEISTQYTKGGQYSVSLTAVDDKNCSNTLSRKDILEVLSPREVLLTKQFLSTCGLPWILEFTNNDIQEGVEYTWDFGNGETYSGDSPPSVEYQEIGNYTVTVEATQANCTEKFVFDEFVNTSQRATIKYNDSINCVGNSIRFEDDTNLGADSIKWVFGDGTIYYDKVVNHSFDTPGCHSVSLLRYRPGCVDSAFIDCVEIKEIPDYTFTINNQYTCSTPVVIDLIASGMGSFEWAIDNGSGTDTLRGNDLKYQLDKIGNYSADLVFKGDNGCTVTESNIPINIEKFDVNLPSFKPGGCVGGTFTLNDSIVSKLPIVDWHWEILTDDVQVFDEKSPSFVIDEAGLYGVKLIVENSIGCIDTVERSNYIRVGNKPTVEFTADPLDDCIETERSFLDMSTGIINEWIWDFGDSTTSNEQNPMHTYSTLDTFDVMLYVAHNGCGTTLNKEDYINTVKPRSSFSIEFNCDEPTDVVIVNNSSGADSIRWIIELSPSQSDTILDSLIGEYQFPDLGLYPIKLWTKNIETGCEHSISDTLFIGRPRALYVPDTTFGCVPLEVTFSNQSVNADSSFYFYNSTFIETDKITYDSIGIYNGPMLIAQDVNKCRDTFSLEDIITANGLEAVPEFSAIVCAPDTVLFEDKSVVNFAEISNYTWRVNGATIRDSFHQVYFEKSGVYDVFYKVEDSWGCKDSILLPNAIDVVEVNPDFVADSLGCTVTNIKFIPSGNDANTSAYLWTFGDGDSSDVQVANHEYANEGVYEACLTLYDIRGCENTLCKENYIDIKDPHASFSADPIEAPCPPLLTDFTNLSTNANSFEWNFGDESGISRNDQPSHLYSEPDTFSVALIAIRSDICADTFSIADLIKLKGPKAEIDYNLEGNCLPLTINISAESDKPYKYFWDFGNGDVDTSETNISEDAVSYTYETSGLYAPKLIVQDDSGCKRIFSTEDVHANEIDVDLGLLKDTFCGIPSLVEMINNSYSSSTITSYQWNVTNGVQDFVSFEDAPTFTIEDFGSYDVQLIGESDNCIDSLLIDDLFSVHQIPISDFEAIQSSLCDGNESSFINNSSIDKDIISQFLWFIDGAEVSKLDSLKYVFDEPGSYQVQLVSRSNYGCSDTISKLTTIQPGIDFSLTGDTLICIGEEVILDASIPFSDRIESYQWILPQGDTCNQCEEIEVLGNLSSTFTFLLESIESCVYEKDVFVEVAPVVPPQLNIIHEDTICKEVNTLVMLDNPLGDWNIVWLVDADTICDDCKDTEVSLSNNANIHVIVENQYGCVSESSSEIFVESNIPNFLLERKDICEGEETFLKVEGEVFNPIWRNESHAILCNDCDSLSFSTESSAMVFVEVMSDKNCVYHDSILVESISPQSIDAGRDTTICFGETVQFTGKGIGSPSWMPFEAIDDAYEYKATLRASTSGFYTLTTTQGECVLKDSVYIEVLNDIEVITVGDTVCFGEDLNLFVSGNAQIYNWYLNGDLLGNMDSISMAGDDAYDFEVIGQRKGCPDNAKPIEIMVHPEIDYRVTKKSYLLDLNSKKQVEADFNKERRYAYDWLPLRNLDCYDCPEPFIYGLDTATMFTNVIIDMESLCEITDSVFVRVSNKCSNEGFYRPNVISSRSSGENNVFKITALDEREFIELQIFDRWGNKVFVSDQIDQGWNGSFAGGNGQNGVYVYRVEAICPDNGEKYFFTGDVTLIR